MPRKKKQLDLFDTNGSPLRHLLRFSEISQAIYRCPVCDSDHGVVVNAALVQVSVYRDPEKPRAELRCGIPHFSPSHGAHCTACGYIGTVHEFIHPE